MEVGELLGGRYRLDDSIGAGGMGEVWRATETVLGRTVAVKILRPDLSADSPFGTRFRAEAHTLATMHHPGVVDVYDYGEIAPRRCDVKPDNILINSDGRAVLVDFGVAHTPATQDLTGVQDVIGIALYMAPEQAMKHAITPATDVYALASVAYECLTGVPPFTGESPVSVASARRLSSRCSS